MLSRILITSVILFILWLLLSGHIDPLLLSLGAISCLGITWLSLKLAVINPKADTLRLTLKLPKFLPWFFIEVVKSNLDVSWRILHPKLPISPIVSSIPVSEHNEVGKVVYANCITLTPGTYSLDISTDFIKVHSLSKHAAEELEKGLMGKRILALETRSQDKTIFNN